MPFRRLFREKDVADLQPNTEERARQPELAYYMDQYPVWRSLFDGSALQEKIPVSTDPAKQSDETTYRWPVRFNLVKAYCVLYAGLLWGRGKTGAEADNLFDIDVAPDIPGRSGPVPKAKAKLLAECLNYFWSEWFHIVRPSGAIQQWAGGCVIKVCWDPSDPLAVFGCTLQTIQPEHFYPIWDPLNFERLLAVNLKFSVSRAVAKEKYLVTDEQLVDYAVGDAITIEEHWDPYTYYVALGKGRKGPEDRGIVARYRDRKSGAVLPMNGDNPYLHPATGVGVIPVIYIPRIRLGGFFGDSLADGLIGLQAELNKTLADFGDALNRGAHPPFGLSDYRGPGSRAGPGDRANQVILIPRSGALNLGETRQGQTPPKVHTFPEPSVPAQTEDFTDRLLSLSEVATGLTPAARGAITSTKSGYAIALELLPTTNAIDWERAHWTSAIAGRTGINSVLLAIWAAKSRIKAKEVPAVADVTAFLLHQSVMYRPVIPRDRMEVVDEVVRLAIAKAVSPQEWLRRLGEIPDVDAEVYRLATWVAWTGQIQAAVAGRGLEITPPDQIPSEPPQQLPEVKGEVTTMPAPKAPSAQPQGQKSVKETE